MSHRALKPERSKQVKASSIRWWIFAYRKNKDQSLLSVQTSGCLSLSLSDHGLISVSIWICLLDSTRVSLSLSVSLLACSPPLPPLCSGLRYPHHAPTHLLVLFSLLWPPTRFTLPPFPSAFSLLITESLYLIYAHCKTTGTHHRRNTALSKSISFGT